MEEQLKQRVIGERYCVSRKKEVIQKEVLAVLGLQFVCQMYRKKREVFFLERRICLGCRSPCCGMVGYVLITTFLSFTALVFVGFLLLSKDTFFMPAHFSNSSLILSERYICFLIWLVCTVLLVLCRQF